MFSRAVQLTVQFIFYTFVSALILLSPVLVGLIIPEV